MEPYYDGTMVAVCFTSADSFWSAFYFIGSITLFFLVPFGILVLLYTAIAYKLLRRHSEFQRTNSPNMENAGGTITGTTITGEAIGIQESQNMPHSPTKEVMATAVRPLMRRFNVNSHPQNTNLRKHRQQVIFMLVTVVSSFFVCLLPFRAFTLWVIASTNEDIASLGIDGYYNILYFCRIMLYLNSALNPILYNLMSSKFRTGFWRLILSCFGQQKHKHGLCNRRHHYNHQHHHHHHQHHITTNSKRTELNAKENSIKDGTSLRSRRPLKREATFVVNSMSTSSGTDRTSNNWRSNSLSTSLTGTTNTSSTIQVIIKPQESHSLAAAITDMGTKTALTTMYLN